MAAAIAASLADQDPDAPVQLGVRGFDRKRSSVSRGGTHSTLARNRGLLMQINTFDQFHSYFKASIREFQTPSAICGYISMASALACSALLAKLPSGRIESVEQLKALEAKMRDAATLLPSIRSAMRYVRDSRQRYIDNHPRAFRTAHSRTAYLRAWVANYEISDYFRDCRREYLHSASASTSAGAGAGAGSGSGGERASEDAAAAAAAAALSRDPVSGVVFMRFNQSPEIGDATHEELERLLLEEQQFAAPHRAKCDKGAEFLPGDTLFLAESFSPQRRLEKPEAYYNRIATTETAAAAAAAVVPPPSVFVLDLNGHFCICLLYTSPSPRDRG